MEDPKVEWFDRGRDETGRRKGSDDLGEAMAITFGEILEALALAQPGLYGEKRVIGMAGGFLHDSKGEKNGLIVVAFNEEDAAALLGYLKMAGRMEGTGEN